MKKIKINDFKFHYKRNALFISENNIIAYPDRNTPAINFKDGLDLFGAKIEEVFLDRDQLYVALNKMDNQHTMAIHASKYFLRGMVGEDVNHMLRAVQWLGWNKKNRYCGKCGNEIYVVPGACEKKCTVCNLSFFPSLSPAVMVLLKRENKILLARGPHFPKGIYSALAGFVDIGETVECAAHREVQEEVGLKIKSLEYFGSQSWPFPSSFMIAFTAEYLDGDITMELNEIEDAKWFNVDHLPELAPMPSISRKLIDAAVEKIKSN
jgi:NAD+ diphosphatase